VCRVSKSRHKFTTHSNTNSVLLSPNRINYQYIIKHQTDNQCTYISPWEITTTVIVTQLYTRWQVLGSKHSNMWFITSHYQLCVAIGISSWAVIHIPPQSHTVCSINTAQQNIYTLHPSRTTTRGQSNLTKSASWGAHSPVRGHPKGSKVVPLNSWGRVSY